ncbi:ABC transporter ATP-binding protein [Salipiger thiooxidans]|uniref:ABC transporter ATP-binding protein n=1 Tax=Salipiger thiooxidans TaxID=282683 RepID=UPI001CD39B1C|nr:ABC transporter ATP-binding protein [Salipiger thiooxidans]MCA0851313.1 ABC transporter ATP-binding protein/permease [Salipiger thiooxidans]
MTDRSDSEAGPTASPIKHLLKPIRLRLHCAAAMAGLGQILTLVPLAGVALIGRQALDPSGGMAALQHGTVAALCIGAMVAGLTLLTLAEYLSHLADNALTDGLRRRVTERLMHVPLGWFTARASGSVKQALQDDMNTLHELTAHYFTTRARCIAAIGAAACFLVWIDWRMAIISLVPFPLYHLIFVAAKKSIGRDRMESFAAAQAGIGDAVGEFSRAMPVLRTFGKTGEAHAAYSGAVRHFLDAFLHFTRPLVAPLANANALITPVSVASIVLAAGVLFVGLGWMAPADLLPFLLVAPGVSAPMMLLGFMAHGLAHATAAADRIDAVLRVAPLPAPGPGTAAVPDGHILRFERVGYAYEGGAGALSGIDLTLEPGSVTAITGASGAGKSTIARLALRFFDPSEGRITLGGIDLRDLDSAELYKRIGFVLQEVQLLNASLRDNIALGRPDASRAEIEAAATVAQIHDRILALPRGYDSVIGQDADLSGGEAQRVSIARALLLDPPILVLDEVTAAMDAEGELALQQALSELARGRTLLVIAHRLETIAGADRIIVLERGRIRESGTHAALLARGGPYAALWVQAGHVMPGDTDQAEAVQ